MSIRMSLNDGLAAGSLLRHAFIVFRYVRGDFSGMFGNSGWYVKALEDLERAGRIDEALMVVLVSEGLLIELAEFGGKSPDIVSKMTGLHNLKHHASTAALLAAHECDKSTQTCLHASVKMQTAWDRSIVPVACHQSGIVWWSHLEWQSG